MEITCVGGKLRASYMNIETHTPSAVLRQILADWKSPHFDDLPSFTGGLVGYFSYDYLFYSEPTARRNVEDSEGFKDMDLMLFDKVIAFDHMKQKIILIVNMRLDDGETGYNKAVLELKQMSELLRTGSKKQEPPGRLLGEVTPLFGKERFCDMVESAKRYIREGDIFQIVLSNRLSAPFEGSLFNTYRLLRTINPSPYMFYFSGTDVEVAGASPETLVKLENGVLHTFPLAGTRPRGRSTEEDNALEAELLADEKELAEHNMLVDLGRNDLGKISKHLLHDILRFIPSAFHPGILHHHRLIPLEEDAPCRLVNARLAFGKPRQKRRRCFRKCTHLCEDSVCRGKNWSKVYCSMRSRGTRDSTDGATWDDGRSARCGGVGTRRPTQTAIATATAATTPTSHHRLFPELRSATTGGIGNLFFGSTDRIRLSACTHPRPNSSSSPSATGLGSYQMPVSRR